MLFLSQLYSAELIPPKVEICVFDFALYEWNRNHISSSRGDNQQIGWIKANLSNSIHFISFLLLWIQIFIKKFVKINSIKDGQASTFKPCYDVPVVIRAVFKTSKNAILGREYMHGTHLSFQSVVNNQQGNNFCWGNFGCC